jgi:hypothetical protein
MDDDVINVRRYCVRLKMKHHTSSLNSRVGLLEWSPLTLYKLECLHILLVSIQRRSPMTSKENKRKYADEEEEEVTEESTATSKKRRASSNDNGIRGLFQGGTHQASPLR